MKILSPAQRSALRARGHALSPLVRVAAKGLSPSVLAEIDRCLASHELLKIRLFDADREAREAMLGEICAALDASPVQHIGKLLLIWRERPQPVAAAAAPPPPRRRGAPRLTKKLQAEVAGRRAGAAPGKAPSRPPSKPRKAAPTRRT